MKKNNLSWILGLLFVMALGVASCSDEFNEEEFIEKQADLAESKAAADHQRALEVIQAQLQSTLDAIEAQKNADDELARLQAMLNQELQMLMQSIRDKNDSTAAANYLAAYRAAGLFTEFTVVVNDRDGEPLADAEVRVSSIADAVTTGADGMAVFTDVVVGNNLLTVTSDDVLDFRANVVFNRLNIERINTTNPVVEPTTAMLALNLFAELASSDEVGTISGTVTIETDLTNDTPEFPTGAAVSADLSNYLNSNNVIAFQDPNLGAVNSMALTEGDLGVGEIDPATGNYELKVPIAGNGSNVNLIFPEITADQTLAISERDGNEIPAEIATVPARFNLNNVIAPDVEPVQGYEVVVNEPATIGSGFELNYTKMPFDIANAANGGFFGDLDDAKRSTEFSDEFGRQTARVTLSLESRGSGYESSPTVSVGTDSIGYGWLRMWASALNVVDEGTGYGAEQPVDITLRVYQRGGGQFDQFIKTVTSDADGTLPTDLEFEATDEFGSENILQAGYAIDSVGIIVSGAGSDAEISPVIVSEMYGVTLDNLNNSDLDESYTEFPNLTITGGTTNATVSVTTANRYFIDIANVGTGYTIEPTFTFTGTVDQGGGDISQSTTGNIAYRSRQSPGQDTETSFSLFIQIDGEGGLEPQNESFSLQTLPFNYWVGEPVLSQDLFTQQLEVGVQILDQDEGSLVGNVVTSGANYDENRTVTVTPRIAGIGGAGFEWVFNDNFDASIGRYDYAFNDNIVSNGSGYKANLNILKEDPVGASTANVFVRRGETTTVDRYYGTGVRLENVGGDN